MPKLNIFSHSFPSLYTFFGLLRYRPMMFFKRLPLAWTAHKAASPELITPFDFTLFDFEKPEASLYFEKRDDSDRGGMSTIKHTYNETDECMDVRGTVNTESIDMMTHPPFVGIAAEMWPTFKCYEGNFVRIKFRGDGNTYKFHMDVANSSTGFFIATGMIVDQTREWQTLEIPFHFMKHDDMTGGDFGFVTGHDMRIYGVGFVCITEQQTNFRFQVKSVEIGFQPWYNKTYFCNEFQKTPMMFKRFDSDTKKLEDFQPKDMDYGLEQKKIHEERF